MKLLYWNIKGIANSSSRLALKRHILTNKPGNIHAYVSDFEMKLRDIQDQIHLQRHDDNLMNEEKQAHITLNEALHIQDIFRQEKARVS